jgi:hypothetical protein
VSRLTNIRGALQTRLDDVAGFPPVAQRSYQGLKFDPTVGTPWARLTLMTVSGRPFDLAGESRVDAGLFHVEVYQPANTGTETLEQLADDLTQTFRPGTDLINGSIRLSIQYAQPGAVIEEPDWIKTAVTIAWRCKSQA